MMMMMIMMMTTMTYRLLTGCWKVRRMLLNSDNWKGCCRLPELYEFHASVCCVLVLSVSGLLLEEKTVDVEVGGGWSGGARRWKLDPGMY